MSASRENTPDIRIAEGRFSRFEAIDWWDQDILRNAKILVIGAGALGNELIKNLALLGVGNLAIVDMDHIEESNLTRSVLFRKKDEGTPKAEAAARAARELYPEIRAIPLHGNLLADIGYAWFRWADVVLGALDNREARVFTNRACHLTGKAWFDGGIDVLNGVVRGFHAPESACYECTMSATDWELVNRRKSCSVAARRAHENQGVPTTPTTASIIGAIQAQEVLKYLHGMKCFKGEGFFFEGISHQSYPISYGIKKDCDCHYEADPIVDAPGLNSDNSWAEWFAWAATRLPKTNAVDFNREIVSGTLCPGCGKTREVFQNLEKLREVDVRCDCGEETVPQLMHSLYPDSHHLKLSPRQTGLPPHEIVWFRNDSQSLGVELDASINQLPHE